MQRARQTSESCPPEPVSLNQLVLRDEDEVLSNGENRLFYDSGPSSCIILMFSTQRNLRLLEQAEIVFSDWTFKCAPSRLFPQLYTIHGKYYGAVVPLLYCLLPNKRGATYMTLDKCAAWQSYFVSSFIAKGCFIHSVYLSQSHWTWFQKTIWRSRRSFCPLDKAT